MPNPDHQCSRHSALGWSEFGVENWTLVMLCQIVLGPQFQNVTYNVAFKLCAGPQKNWTATLKSTFTKTKCKRFFSLRNRGMCLYL